MLEPFDALRQEDKDLLVAAALSGDVPKLLECLQTHIGAAHARHTHEIKRLDARSQHFGLAYMALQTMIGDAAGISEFLHALNAEILFNQKET